MQILNRFTGQLILDMPGKVDLAGANLAGANLAKWDEDRWNECANGIHFFITREEAEAY